MVIIDNDDTPRADGTKADTASEAPAPDGLEVVTPQKDELAAEEKPAPKRRRKAPSRKKAEDASAEEVAAAE